VTVFFWILTGLMAWCYVGYPLFLRGLAWLRPHPWRQVAAAGDVLVSVVLAVRNGVGALAERIENLLEQEHAPGRLEVLVVCNGCDDGSLEVAEVFARRDARVRVLVTPAEEGKAGALNAGVARARGSIVVFADVRQTFAPGALRRLLEPFADREVGAVSGRLVVRRADRPVVEGIRWYWGYETALRIAESRTGSIVGATGAIYAVRRKLFEPVPPNLILDDVFVPLRVAMGGARVVLAERAVAIDVPAETGRHEFLRKRRTAVGNFQLLRAIPGLLSPRANPILGRYLSHKLLRLLSPLAIPLIVLSGATLPGVVPQTVFWSGLVLYVLGAVGLLLPNRLLGLPSAFVLVQAAVASALVRAHQDARHVWIPGAPSEPAAEVQAS
jgi:cellulose synthase/poly-beta-1,6-N-acetylglucosamine synthase-like glycosyltransferase